MVPCYNSSKVALPFALCPCRQEMEAYAAAVATLDLRSPHTWYPFARALQRKIIYHGGVCIGEILLVSLV